MVLSRCPTAHTARLGKRSPILTHQKPAITCALLDRSYLHTFTGSLSQRPTGYPPWGVKRHGRLTATRMAGEVAQPQTTAVDTSIGFRVLIILLPVDKAYRPSPENRIPEILPHRMPDKGGELTWPSRPPRVFRVPYPKCPTGINRPRPGKKVTVIYVLNAVHGAHLRPVDTSQEFSRVLSGPLPDKAYCPSGEKSTEVIDWNGQKSANFLDHLRTIPEFHALIKISRQSHTAHSRERARVYRYNHASKVRISRTL